MVATPAIHPRPMDDHLTAFVARRCGVEPERVRLAIQPLPGGLEAMTVLRVRARGPGPSRPRARGPALAGYTQHRERSLDFVVKRPQGEPSREAAIYQHLVEPAQGFAAPALLEVERLDAHSCLLYLEWVRPALIWPWRHTSYIARVVE